MKLDHLAIMSLAVALLVLGLKGVAAWLVGSIALYSDALESVVNVITAIVTLVAIRVARRPATSSLPFGFYKVEYFSAVIVSVFITIAALLIFREAWVSFQTAHRINPDATGLAVSLTATILNAAWARLLIVRGRKAHSQALIADGKHLLSDVLSTVGVLAGVVLVLLTGYQRLDSIVAALVGVGVLWSGWSIVRASVRGLMDVSVDAGELSQIRALIAEAAGGAIEAHDVRTRRAGRAVFIDFHLVVAGSMSVTEAHEICDRVEARLKSLDGDALITIHVEPQSQAKHTGLLVI